MVIADEYVSVFSADMSPLERGIVQGNTALKSLESQIAQNNTSLRGFDGQLADARSALAEMAVKIESAKEAFGRNSIQVKELQSEYRQMSLAMREAGAAKGQLVLQTNDLKNAEGQAAVKVKELEAALKAQQQAAAASGQAFQKISTSIQDVASGMARAGGLISGFVTAPLAAISEMGRTFETELRRVAANTAMTDAELNVMRQTVMDLGRNSAAPLADIAHGFEHAANFGFNAAESAKILDVAMQGAVATGAHTTDVTNTLAGVLHQFGMNADQASVTLNTLKEAAGKGNLTLEQMVNVSGRVFSTAANLGLSLNEAAGAMSALTRAGFPAAQASTQLVGALTHLVNPTSEMRKEIAALSKATGVDMVHDFSQAGLQAKGLSGVLADVKKAVGDNTSEMLKLFGGIRGGLGAMALATNAADDYKKILGSLADTMEGKLTPIQDAYAREVNTLGFQFGELKNRLTLLGDALNNAFSGNQVNFVKQLNEAVDGLTRGFQLLDPAMQAAVITFLGAFAIGGPILLGVGAVAALIGGPLTIAIIGVTAALSILAADWLSGNDKAINSTESLKQSLLELVPVLGMVADVMGIVANAAFVAWSASTAQIRAAIQFLTGDWIGAMKTIDDSNRTLSKGLGNIWDELNGKWEGVLTRLVNSAFSASSGFGAAGQANAAAYMAGLSRAGIIGGVNPLSKFLPTQDVAGPPTVEMMTGKLIYPALQKSGERAAAAFTSGFGGGMKKGGGLSKPILDAFQTDGGLDAAIAKISANTGKLAGLFDPVTKKARAGGEELKSALSAVAKNINDFMSAAGIKANITAADLASNWAKFQGVIGKTDAFDHLKNALNSINLDQVAAGLNAFDTSLKINNGAIEISVSAFEALKQKFPQVAAEIAKVGLTTKQVFPAMKVDLDGVKNAAEDGVESAARFGEIWLQAANKAAGFALKALPTLKQALKDLKETVELNPIFADVKVGNEAAQWIESIISEFEREGQRMGLTGEALMNHALEGVRKVAPVFTGEMGKVAESVIEAHKKAAIQLPGIWESIFGKINSSAKKQVSGLLDIIGALPGGFKKVADSIESWVSRIDTILKGLHKIFSSIPDGLSGVFQKITDLFKGAQSSTQKSTGGILDNLSLIIKNFSGPGGYVEKVPGSAKIVNAALDEMGFSAAKSLGGMAQTASSTASGIASSMGSIAGGIGIATAAIGLFIATFQSSSKAIRFAGGGLIGLIFGGPNELQKAQMAAQLQAAKDAIKLSQEAVKQAIEATNQAMTKTASDIADLMAKIADGLHVPKRMVQQFVVEMTRLLGLLADGLKSVASKATPELKAAAENFAPVVALAGGAVDAFDRLNSFIAPASRTIDEFFASLTVVVGKFGELAESVPKALQKHAAKFAEKMKSVVEVIGGAVFAFLGNRGNGVESVPGLIDFKGIPAEAFELFKQGLQLAVQKMAEIADSIDANMVKQASRFSDKAKSVADILKSGVEGLVAIAGFAGVPEAAFSAFGEGIKGAINLFIKLADELNVELLGRAVIIAQAVAPIADALKAWAEASIAVKGYTAIASDTWDNIKIDFDRTVSLINLMLASAIGFLPKAEQFENVMKTIADHLRAGLDSLGNGLNAAASAFGAVVNNIQGGAAPGSVFPGGDNSGVASQAFAPNFAGRGGASQSQTFNFHFHGDVTAEAGFQNRVITAMVQAQRQGRTKVVIV